MHAQPTARKPAPMLARRAMRLRRCVRPDAFGNALGSSFTEASSIGSNGSGWNYSTEEMAGDYAREKKRFASAAALNASTDDGYTGGEAWAADVVAGPAANPMSRARDAVDAASAFRDSERIYRQRTESSVQGTAYRAVTGDSISRMVGSSRPQDIGNFMAANGLTDDRIELGRNYFLPESNYAYGDQQGLGQIALAASYTRSAAPQKALVAPWNTSDVRDLRLSRDYERQTATQLAVAYDIENAPVAEVAHRNKMSQKFGWSYDEEKRRFVVPDRLLFKAAAVHYMYGRGEPVQVRGELINLDYIEQNQFESVLKGRQIGFVAEWGKDMRGKYTEDRYVYGSVTARPDGMGNVWLQDIYEFEPHNTPSSKGRDRATSGAKLVNEVVGAFVGGDPLKSFSNGTNFKIRIMGATPVPGHYIK